MRVASRISSRTGRHRPALVLGAVAFLVYAVGFWWGAPTATAADRADSWGVDDETPLGPLAQMHNIIEPKDFQNLGYPLMHYFTHAAAYAPYLGVLWATGELREPAAVYPFGLSDPETVLRHLSWISNLLSALLAAGVVVATTLAAEALWGRRTGWLAGLFTLVSYPMFYYGRTGNVDMTVLFFTAVALAVFARMLKSGVTTPRAAWLGAAVGFALATKEPSFASFLAFPFVVPWLQARDAPEGRGPGSWRFWKPSAAAVGAAIVAFGFGSGLFVDPERYFNHLQFGAERTAAIRSGAVAFMRGAPWTVEGHATLAWEILSDLAVVVTPFALLLAVAGFGLAARKTPRLALFCLPAVTYLAVLFLVPRTTQLRYVLPVVPSLMPFAAYATIRAVRSGSRWLRATATATAALAVGLGAAWGLGLTWEMLKDSRYDAGAWLADHAPPGARVAYFGPAQKLPPLRRDVESERAALYLGAVHGGSPETADDVLSRWEGNAPDLVLVIPDHSSARGEAYSGACPEALCRGLLAGRLPFRRVASFRTPPLLSWLPPPRLDYPSVNPPIQVFAPIAASGGRS